MRDKLKSYSFWMSVTAGVILVINNIGKVCGFAIESDVAIQIVDSICGVLILFGVLTMSTKKESSDNNQNYSDDEKSAKHNKMRKGKDDDYLSKDSENSSKQKHD